MKMFKLIVISILIGVPGSFLLTFLLTPILWRLEPALGMELAGHSGPAEWVFQVNLVVITLLVFAVLKLAAAIFGSKEGSSTPRL